MTEPSRRPNFFIKQTNAVQNFQVYTVAKFWLKIEIRFKTVYTVYTTIYEMEYIEKFHFVYNRMIEICEIFDIYGIYGHIRYIRIFWYIRNGRFEICTEFDLFGIYGKKLISTLDMVKISSVYSKQPSIYEISHSIISTYFQSSKITVCS